MGRSRRALPQLAVSRSSLQTGRYRPGDVESWGWLGSSLRWPTRSGSWGTSGPPPLGRRVEGGEEVVIRRGKHPVARLVAVRSQAVRQIGREVGRFTVPDDFEALMPDEFLDASAH